MIAANNLELKINPQKLCRHINIRKADINDLEDIYDVACTVGNIDKDPDQGFLMDNYMSDPVGYKNFIRSRLNNLQHMYVAEYDRVYGFMIAYTKEQWLEENPEWIENIYWKPDFDKSKLEDFIVIDKTAIAAGYTGMGIGSMLYSYLLDNLQDMNVKNIFAETIISPSPNFASLQFRIKQKYTLAGVRYEEYGSKLYTDLIYYKYADR